MKKIKHILKVAALILLIILAVTGISLVGGIPNPFSGKKKDKNMTQTELVEKEKQIKKTRDYKVIE
jgi:hypothetical protein